MSENKIHVGRVTPEELEKFKIVARKGKIPEYEEAIRLALNVGSAKITGLRAGQGRGLIHKAKKKGLRGTLRTKDDITTVVLWKPKEGK